MGGAQALPPSTTAASSISLWIDSEDLTADVGRRAPRGGRRRHRPRRLRPARHRGQDRGHPLLPRAQVPFLGVCLGMQCAVHRVRAQRLRHERRQLDGVRRGDAVPGHRPACRSRRTSPTWAARCASAPQLVEARRRHAGPGRLRRRRRSSERHRHRYEVNNDLRRSSRPAGLRRQRHLAGRPPRRDRASCPITPGSWPRSSTPSSSRGPRARRRCSATSSAPPRACASSETTSWRMRAQAPAVDELRDLFLRLAGIRSPSGEEREVADFVTEYVRGSGLDGPRRTPPRRRPARLRQPPRPRARAAATAAHRALRAPRHRAARSASPR